MRIVQWWMAALLLAIALTLSATGGFAQYDYNTPRPAPSAAGAGNLPLELQTALTHAGFAAKYDSLNEVTLHLHHVLNCLVGPSDTKMFDAAAGNPCQGQGSGILVDIQGMGTGKYNEAWWAAHLADQAIMMKNLDQAKAAARIITLVLSNVAR